MEVSGGVVKKSEFYEAVADVLKELEYKYIKPEGAYYAVGPEIEMLTKAFPLLAEKLKFEKECEHEPQQQVFIDGSFSKRFKCKHCHVEMIADWKIK